MNKCRNCDLLTEAYLRVFNLLNDPIFENHQLRAHIENLEIDLKTLKANYDFLVENYQNSSQS